MAEEIKKEEERDDAAAGTLLKTAIDRMDALHKRLDAMEEERKDSRRKDSEEEERKDRARKDSEKEEEEKREDAMKMDKSRKDSEEERKDKMRKDSKEEEREDRSRKDSKEEERDDNTVFYRGNKAPKSESKGDSEEEERKDSEERKDAARKDEEAMADAFTKVADRIARVERMLPAQLSDEDRAKFSEVQARADSVFHAFGSAAPAPLQGETLLAYRQRLTNSLKTNSKLFKDVNVYAIGDATAFSAIEDVVYTDAMSVAMSPATAQPGTLRPISKKSGGHEFITYVGDPAAWMNDFAGPVRQYATAIHTPNQGQR